MKEERTLRRDLGFVCLVRLWIWERRCGRRVCRRWVRRVAEVVEEVKRRVPWVGVECVPRGCIEGCLGCGWGELDVVELETPEEEVSLSESETDASEELEEVGSSSCEEVALSSLFE